VLHIVADAAQREFAHEYRREIESWLSRRLRYFCIACLIFAALDLTMVIVGMSFPRGSEGVTRLDAIEGTFALFVILAGASAVLAILSRREWREGSRERVLRVASWLILFLGSITILSALVLHTLNTDRSINPLFALFAWHLAACLFLPWTPRESIRPFLPLMGAWFVVMVIVQPGEGVWPWLGRILFSPLIFLPGVLICWWRLRRHGERFASRMRGKLFSNMREELKRARAIHESLFPDEFNDQRIGFRYSFTPMRDMGGDFIHVNRPDPDRVDAILIDVTGHGLASALTVNRLYGEIERLRAEMPNATPAEMIRLLNRYIWLTLAKHGVFATAIAFSVDMQRGVLTWASAGHPPAFLLGVNGSMTDLDSTTYLLGAVGDEEFVAEDRQTELSPNDLIIAYTDGAFEVRGRYRNQARRSDRTGQPHRAVRGRDDRG